MAFKDEVGAKEHLAEYGFTFLKFNDRKNAPHWPYRRKGKGYFEQARIHYGGWKGIYLETKMEKK